MQRNGVVGNQTNRPLDRNEFKGFALADRYAPLIFINGKDWPASQMFTIAHECVHLWLGLSAVPDGDWYSTNNDPTERFCNQVAAEILMPANEVTALWKRMGTVREDIRRMIRTFHVSSLSLLIKVRSLGLISDDEFLRARSEEEREFESSEPSSQSSGGNYYYTAGTRLGKRFIREVLISTLEGKTSYSEAFDLLGTKKTEVFNGLVKQYLQEESK